MTDPTSGTAPAGVSNLTLRIASAAVMAPVAIGAAYLGNWSFSVFWTAASIAVLWEWTTLACGPAQVLLLVSGAVGLVIAAVDEMWLATPVAAVLPIGLGALAAAIFAPRERRIWVIAGVGYAGVMLLAPLLLRNDPALGFAAVMLIFAVVWSTDILAYFGGRAIGGPKLCAAISPKKTWSGAVTGTLGAMAISIGVLMLFGTFNWTAIAVLAFVLSVLSQAGDLLESWVKRHFGAKDASHIIPGHGGVMDRLDGFWAAAFAACLIGLVRGGFDGVARGLLLW